MKRRDLIKALARQAVSAGVAFTFERHGGRHDIYKYGPILVQIPRMRRSRNRWPGTF